jgi:hypothetical protein
LIVEANVKKQSERKDPLALIGFVTLGLTYRGESARISISAFAAEVRCARPTLTVVVDNPTAQICDSVLRAKEQSGTTDIARLGYRCVSGSDLIWPDWHNVVLPQVGQVWLIHVRKDVEIGGASGHYTGACATVNHLELDSQRLIVRGSAVVQVKYADRMDDHERTMRRDKFLAGKTDLLLSEKRSFPCKVGLCAGSQPENESEHAYGEAGDGGNRPIILVKGDSLAPEGLPHSTLDALGTICVLIATFFLGFGIALLIGGREGERAYKRNNCDCKR